jgi:hypothetical protein
VLGYGFWQGGNQLGAPGALVTLLALAILALAAIGARELPAWRWRATALAGVGAAIAVGSAVPVLDGIYDALSRTPLGQPLREGQKVLPLALVFLAPAAALGARRIAAGLPREELRAAPAAILAFCVLLIVSPWLWGLGGRLDPVDVPDSWEEASELVGDEGTVLALPWHQYFDLEAAEGRRSYNPVPLYLEGDVIASSDPELGSKSRETADRREDEVPTILDDIDAGEPIAPALERLGVRWIVGLTDLEEERLAALEQQPGLTRRLDTPEIQVWELDDWGGEAVAADGAPVEIDNPIAPLASVDSAEEVTWRRAGGPGWVRGFSGAEVTDDGLLRVPGGSGPLWFWPAALVVLAYLAVGIAAVRAALSLRSERVRSE